MSLPWDPCGFPWCEGVAFSLHSTCILPYSEVPSMHSAFRPCLQACSFVDFRVGATRPTTLFIILEGEIAHGPSSPQTSRPFMAWGHHSLGGSCLAAGLPSRLLQSILVHSLHTCCIVLVHGMHRRLASPPLSRHGLRQARQPWPRPNSTNLPDCLQLLGSFFAGILVPR